MRGRNRQSGASDHIITPLRSWFVPKFTRFELRMPDCVVRMDTLARRPGVGVGWIFSRSGSGSVVVIQQPAEAFPPFHFPALTDEFWIRAYQMVIEALMVALTVIMYGEL